MLHREVHCRIVDRERVANIVYVILGSIMAAVMAVMLAALMLSIMTPYTSALTANSVYNDVDQAIVNPCFNVRTYGAMGDGLHDDTDAIQATINAACDASQYSFVYLYFPSGYYIADLPQVSCSGLTWDLGPDVYLEWRGK